MEIGTTGGVVGAASTKEPAKLRIGIQCESPRPEYSDNVKRVMDALNHVCAEDADFVRAITYLAADTTFAITVQGAAANRLILPATVIGR